MCLVSKSVKYVVSIGSDVVNQFLSQICTTKIIAKDGTSNIVFNSIYCYIQLKYEIVYLTATESC